MLRGTWICLLCALSVLASPAPAQKASTTDGADSVPKGVEFCPNLTYCKLKDRELKLDLAYPTTGKGPFPAVVLIHGSGRFSKGRKFNLPQVFELAQKGYVAVTVSYRHLPEEPFPGAIHDAKCSIRWLRAHAADYKIDPERIGVIGFSAGGSLALLLALAPRQEGTGGERRPCRPIEPRPGGGDLLCAYRSHPTHGPQARRLGCGHEGSICQELTGDVAGRFPGKSARALLPGEPMYLRVQGLSTHPSLAGRG
jgi:hypothetical protein